MGGRILVRVAIGLISLGLLLLAFVAYQLWGTAFYEHSVQSQLRRELPAWLTGQATAASRISDNYGKLRHPDGSSGAKQRGAGTDPSTATTTTTSTPRGGLPPLASTPAPTTVAPSVGTGIGYLVIPKIGLDDVFTEGVGEAQLQGGPGHYPGTSLPGQAGNAAIAGHRTTYAAPFYNLNELSPGDPIFVLTTQGLFRYNVVSQTAVLPTDVTVLNQTADNQLTLTTCNPRYSAAQRLVVVADMQVQALHRPVVPPRPPVPVKPRFTTLAGDSSLAGNGANRSVTAAVLWGVLTLLLGMLVAIAWRGLHRLRWASLVLGAPVVLLSLLVFFQHVSLVLPASF